MFDGGCVHNKGVDFRFSFGIYQLKDKVRKNKINFSVPMRPGLPYLAYVMHFEMTYKLF